MKTLHRLIVVVLMIFFSPAVFAASSFERDIQEIQVYEDRVRIKIGSTYGTCGAKEGWWGWLVTNPSHSDWLALVLSAQAQNKKIIVYDAGSSCSGPPDAIGLEGVFLKVS